LNISEKRNKVVLLDFMAIYCTSCRIVESAIREIAPRYAGLEVLSVDIEPTETTAELQAFRAERGFNWSIARDTASLINRYGAGQIPKVVVIDVNGLVTFTYTGTLTEVKSGLVKDLEHAIDGAFTGEARAVGVEQVTVLGLIFLAALGSFFSPCSFPLLPGFMSMYLAQDAKQAEKRTLRQAFKAAVLTSGGILLVYALLFILVFLAGQAVKRYVPLLGPIVGGILIVTGILLLGSIRFHRLFAPLERLGERISSKGGERSGGGYQLFGYGVGYGAAASACVAPLFIAAILNAVTYGNSTSGLFAFFLYSAVVLLLMAIITISLTAFGRGAVQKLSAYTEKIERISAAVLILVGIYLIYFWYTGWIASA